ncbi:F-box domain containing protein [Parasponia andersonii]|uniref:F-box domain containing protein n=1 Tax=Parasponia andersonii TaxID=3476 RepID=A0A2P5DIM0_PARAD|nr:F-box domain containing protein [Parasponia andersonii]
MELNDDCPVSMTSRKRKSSEEQDSSILRNFSMDELNQDVLERVLSRLPTSSFFRLTSVCKRWKSVAASESFKLACSAIPSRDPWFFMVDPHLNRMVVFDSAERSWKRLNQPPLLQKVSNHNSMPVAASGGLICFRNFSDDLIVCNPLTGSCSQVPSLDPTSQNQPLHAIVMKASSSSLNQSHKLTLVFGELPKLSFRIYNSLTNSWEEEIELRRVKDESSVETEANQDSAVYFLSKAGNVVATNMQRSPCKQYSSVITNQNGEDIVYFLSSTGKVVACNLSRKSFSEYPRLLPVFCEYSIDVVECRGRMLVVLLSEFFESVSLRVWWYDDIARAWRQVAAMPPAMSQEWYGKKVDVNCVGAGDKILICLNSAELFSYVVCDLVANEWVELPKCCVDGKAVEFMSAFSFEPRIEAIA